MFPPEYGPDQGDSLWQTLSARVADEPFNLIATIIFGLAILHTFMAGFFTHLGHRLETFRIRQVERRGETYCREKHLSCIVEMCYFLGEIEIIFGLWVIPLFAAIVSYFNWQTAVGYLESRNFREPLLVIVVMTLASTRPILQFLRNLMAKLAYLLGGSVTAWWLVLLSLGPLLGSLITEPGAMTITAILLGQQFYRHRPSKPLAYATLGLLFVNISVGGVLDHFAAPPVLIVAERWNLTTNFMFMHFGWKAVAGIFTSTLLYFVIFNRELRAINRRAERLHDTPVPIPFWITLIHILFLGGVVLTNHNPVIFIGLFLLFLGFYQATIPHQKTLGLRAPLLVGLFLSGLVIHGGLQGWWISPILSSFTQLPLMLVTTVLTAFNDNAAITYLSSLTPNFGLALRYAVIAGAITGGGLTVIANAPNPAGQQILGKYFKRGVSPLGLFLGALIPTIIMALAFIFLGRSDMFPGT